MKITVASTTEGHSGKKFSALIIWDLDDLKYINDTYGHDEGDSKASLCRLSIPLPAPA